MATSYPTALDSAANLPSTPDPFVDNVTSGHLSHPPTVHGAVRALETKVGIGASTPPLAVGRFLASDGAGGSVWEAPRVMNTDRNVTTYTFALTDAGTAVEFASASDCTATIASTVAWVQGMVIVVSRLNTGQVTIAGSGSTTFRAAFSAPYKLRAQNSVATLRYRGGNEWIIYGDFL